MKFFALCLVVFVAGAHAGGLTEAQKQYLVKWSIECMKETGVSPDAVKKYGVGKWDHVEHNTKCHCKCTQDKANFLIGDKPNIPVLSEILTPIYGKKAVDSANKNCNNIKGENDCDTSFKLHQCYFKHGLKPEIWED